jgi:hypothetical protein
LLCELDQRPGIALSDLELLGRDLTEAVLSFMLQTQEPAELLRGGISTRAIWPTRVVASR